MTRPLVSVVMPVYNHARFVDASIISVCKQTYQPLELIIIDDGSNDKSADIAESVIRQHMPNAVLIRQLNRGANNTINQGLSLASGEYLTILNSDDCYGIDRIARCVETALRTQRRFIFTSVSFVDDDSNLISNEYVESIRDAEKRSALYPTIGYALMKNQIAVTTGNFFFSRSLYEQVGSFRHYRFVHDWDFILRSLAYEEPYFIREPLYHYRLHGDNSFKKLKNIEGYETAEVMRNFLWQMTTKMPINGLAPCPFYWPGFFDWFIKTWNYEVYMPSHYRSS